MRKNMKKIYLIDSENVNDAWVELLPVLEGGDRITVFYTDKSPHMCYQHVIALLEKEREIRFIKCFEGNNALDFQLVSNSAICSARCRIMSMSSFPMTPDLTRS